MTLSRRISSNKAVRGMLIVAGPLRPRLEVRDGRASLHVPSGTHFQYTMRYTPDGITISDVRRGGW